MYGELPVCPMCDMVILQHVALHLSVLLAHVKILSPHMSLHAELQQASASKFGCTCTAPLLAQQA